MGRGLRRTPRAVSDVEESAVYIGRDDLDAALRFVAAVETTLRMLVANPDLGRARTFERSALSGLRSLPVKGFEHHLVFYRPTKEGIEVLRILHGARDLGVVFDEQERDPG